VLTSKKAWRSEESLLLNILIYKAGTIARPAFHNFITL
jgi:hypothetical protein